MRKRWASVLVGLALAGCTRPAGGENGPLRPVEDLAFGEALTLFTADDIDEDVNHFRVEAAYGLPDGTVAVQYDVDAREPGEEGPSQPRLGLLGADGDVRAMSTTSDRGVDVLGSDARLIGAGPDGTLFFWSRGDRVVTRSPSGAWQVLAAELLPVPPQPRAAVAPDGRLYLAGETALMVITPDGSVGTVLDVVVGQESNSDPPRPPLGDLPRPASEVTVGLITGLAVTGDGSVHVALRGRLLVMGPDGMVRNGGTVSWLLGMAGLRTDDPERHGFALGTDANGDLLLSDFYDQRVLIRDFDTVRFLTDRTALAGEGANATFSSRRDLLLAPDQGEALVAFGQ